MDKAVVSIFISTISLIFSIISLCIFAYRPYNLEFDYIGVIVGVLSFLVTVILGWQIYNYLSLRSEMEEMINKIIDDTTTKTTHAMIGYLKARTSSLWGRTADLDSLDNAFEALKEVKLSKGIPSYDIALDFSIDRIIEHINEIKANNKSLSIIKSKKSTYYYILKDIDHEKIEYIKEELDNATEPIVINS
jgi:hypothetical protein